MSQENVEIVRTAIEAFNRGDLKAALASAAPDFEFDLSRANGPFRGVYTLDQALGVTADFVSIWEWHQIEPHQFIEAGEHVVVPWTYRAAARNGLEVEGRTTWTFTFRDGALVRQCVYQEHQEALEAAGLSK